MIFLSVGLPSRFAEWCDNVICALVQAAAGPLDLVSANTCEEIALAMMNSESPRLVVGARQPTDELWAALSETGRRFVMALDDPRAAFQHLVTKHEVEWKVAVRAVAGSCASMISYGAIPGALVLRADLEGRNPVAAATAIAHWLNIEISPAEIAAVLQGQPDRSATLAQGELDAWLTNVPARDRALLDGALNGYIEYFSNGRIGQIVWERDLFFMGDEPHAPADRVFNIGGPVRYLLFGPYMALPPGRWEATIVLAVSKGAANLSYSVEVLAGARFACLARGTIEPHGEGLCETTLELTVSAAMDQPLEFRIANLEPVFDGRLALAHVALSPRTKAHTKIPLELTEALGL